MPNNPNYGLRSLVGSAFDTLTSINAPVSVKDADMHVYYLPPWPTLLVNAQNIKSKNCLLQIFDINRLGVFSFQEKTINKYFAHNVALSTTANGVYIVKLTAGKETLTASL